MENKKNLTTLLIIFGIVLVSGGLYLFYFSRADVEINWFNFLKGETMPVVEMQQVESAKNLTQENVKNFVKSNKLDDLVNNPQYQGLIDPNIQIEIGAVSNPAPFTQPLLETEEEQVAN